MSVFLSNYACGRGADIYGRRIFLQSGLIASAGGFVLHLLARDPISLGIIRIVTGICVGMWGPALLAYVFEAKKSMGKVMGFGGLGWGTGVLIAGLLAQFWHIYLLSVLCFLMAFAIALTLPKLEEFHHKIPLFPGEVLRKSYPAYLAVVIRHAGATAVWVLLPVYLNQQQLFAQSVIGYVYAINAFVQFLVMSFIERFPSKVTISMGLVLTTVCFLFFDRATMIWHWAVLLASVGLSWSLLYVGGTVYVMERNVERATSMGILQGSMSLAGIMGPLIGGVVAQVYEYRYNFYIAASLSMVAFVIFLATYPKVERYIASSKMVDGCSVVDKEEE
jgi:MFS family permease